MSLKPLQKFYLSSENCVRTGDHAIHIRSVLSDSTQWSMPGAFQWLPRPDHRRVVLQVAVVRESGDLDAVDAGGVVHGLRLLQRLSVQ